MSNRILVVEDEDFKIDEILRALSVLDLNFCTDICKSFNEAKRYLRATEPNLVVLDMTLPNWSNQRGRQLALGGEKILKEMRRFKRRSPVIVVSQHEAFMDRRHSVSLRELSGRLQRDFPILTSVVYFDSASSTWTDQFLAAVRAALGGK
jgi:DNA-binding response OmpR family regulator